MTDRKPGGQLHQLMPTDFNLESLDIFKQALQDAPAAAEEAANIALNAGAQVALERGREEVLKELNLEKAYVQKQMRIGKRSTRRTLLAKISAQRRSVLAPRFGAEQKLVPTRSKRVKGDPYRKIPPGQKAAGSTPWGPKRGGKRAAWGNAFFIWGKNSGAWIMVVRRSRDPKAKLDAVYGTSVDQAWRDIRFTVGEEAMETVAEVFAKEYRRLIQ